MNFSNSSTKTTSLNYLDSEYEIAMIVIKKAMAGRTFQPLSKLGNDCY
jgi:hypothetical protein